jgi:hypothetical protein
MLEAPDFDAQIAANRTARINGPVTKLSTKLTSNGLNFSVFFTLDFLDQHGLATA